MIREILDSTATSRNGSGKFSISSVNCCYRRKFLELKGLYKEDFDAKKQRTFDIGDLCHQQVMTELFNKSQAQGFSVVTSECNIPIHSRISGRCDVILSNQKTGELMVVDVKSAGDWTMNKIKCGEVPENYINQVMLYLHFFGIKRGYLLFIGKHKSEIEEVEILYDEVKAKKLVAEIEDFMMNFVEKDILPPKCSGGMFPCEVCQGENAEKYENMFANTQIPMMKGGE